MRFAILTLHVVASPVLDNPSLAGWTLPDSHLLHSFPVVVFILPFLACIVGMALVALQAFDFATNFAVDFAIFLNFVLIKHIFAVLTSEILVSMHL
jgi:hypothetical protein